METANLSAPSGAAGIVYSKDRRFNWRQRYFKKATIPGFVRVHLAKQYGCILGERCPAWCVYCGASGEVIWWSGQWVTFDQLEMDHIFPEFLGGAMSVENIVLACRKCNRSKGHKAEFPSVKFPPTARNVDGSSTLL